jgi:gluconate 2-dehydrogenase gamma chain
MDRRDLIKVLVATPLAADIGLCQHSGHSGHTPDIKVYSPRFFTTDEYHLIDILCETILPADAEVGGAHDAGVAYYIDTNILHSDKRVQEFWRRGLADIDQMSRDQFRRKVTDLDSPARVQLIARLLGNERSPESTLEQFAVRLKRSTIEGYCLSEVGRKYFGYNGNTAVSEFPGCTHPEHKSA